MDYRLAGWLCPGRKIAALTKKLNEPKLFQGLAGVLNPLTVSENHVTIDPRHVFAFVRQMSQGYIEQTLLLPEDVAIIDLYENLSVVPFEFELPCS